ncbi:MAG: UDP-N-acetylglucosamine 2-epimerase (non-hydrolyzing) [Dehalococcoidia bacterium]|nr:UDP-N-acetylglucosamine 2-epimerase (non-hydrolyzing) [Dehalococcoidia bacterium]
MKTAVVLGTRPEIIKMCPVIRELERRHEDYFVLHTGQHYSYSLDGVFFEQLRLPRAKFNLEAGSGSHAEETGKIMVGVEKVLLAEKPDVVLVEGDTNSVLAGALAAAKLHIKVGHVEAGLRSYDRRMPEEVNRILTDHCSTYLFAPTAKARDILRREAIAEESIFVTGNTIVDAVFQNLELAKENQDAMASLQLRTGEYFLVTLHRQENVDDAERFGSILKGLAEVGRRFSMPVIYPIHPRSVKRLERFGLDPLGLRVVDPLDFLGFLQLEANARLVLTDSGGVQEEACILRVPCVTLRDNTERPETIEVGANVLAGANQAEIVRCAEMMLKRERNWQNPFGDGRAAERIVRIITEGS